MHTITTFFDRQCGNYNGRTYDTALGRLSVHESDSWKGIAPSTEGADFNPEPPIFTAKFAKCSQNEHILAIANEDGMIALQNTNLKSTVPESERALNGQQCHLNAVFDLEWMPGHMKFISASGDHTARLWEVREAKFDNSRTFNGHTRSVKTAAFRKNDSAVFATGGRDGAILIWDTRAALNVGAMTRADNCIYSGHSGTPGTPQSCKRKTRHTPKLPANVLSSSITGLVFQDDDTLVSCGAGDGIIKVWDLRRNYSTFKKEPMPKHSIPYPGTSTFKGYTNLMVDNSGLKLYVNCMDNSIYCYNLATYSPEPLIRYVGLRNSTFYIKSSLSPDGQYLLSGSSDEKAYIWNICNPKPLLALVGHTVEVTCVAWSHAADMRVVTCSDDARHKIWRIGPELIEDDQLATYRGRTEFCKEYRNQQQLKVRLKFLENTPRSVRRLVEENETTPSSVEKVGTKRSYAEAMGDLYCHESSDQKRPHIETRGRRLFSPATAGCSSNSNYRETCSTNLASILEESDTANTGTAVALPNTSVTVESTPPSPPPPTHTYLKPKTSILITSPPLAQRLDEISSKTPETPSPISSVCRATAAATVFYSPTSNLPNFVVNGEAPHLPVQSPKRKLKENVDWLTKIRKQKLMSSINSQLNDKLNGHNEHVVVDIANDICMSPRMHSLRAYECSGIGTSSSSSMSSPAVTVAAVPKRRSSRSGSQHSDSGGSPSHKFASNRRNSETSILRFFSVKSVSSSTTSTNSPTQPVASCSSSNISSSGANN